MEKVKIIDKKTGAIKEVNKSIVADYIGTGKFDFYNEKKNPVSKSKFNLSNEDER